MGSGPNSLHVNTVVNEAPEAIMKIAYAPCEALSSMPDVGKVSAGCCNVGNTVNCGYGGGSCVQMHLC